MFNKLLGFIDALTFHFKIFVLFAVLILWCGLMAYGNLTGKLSDFYFALMMLLGLGVVGFGMIKVIDRDLIKQNRFDK